MEAGSEYSCVVDRLPSETVFSRSYRLRDGPLDCAESDRLLPVLLSMFAGNGLEFCRDCIRPLSSLLRFDSGISCRASDDPGIPSALADLDVGGRELEREAAGLELEREPGFLELDRERSDEP